MTVPRGTGFDAVVIGAGHAGCEAALALCRRGHTCALLNQDLRRIAWMSCNPAIGGLGKSHIVREIDALGGEMGRAADATAIHYRRLNESKGPAVRARRVQCDMVLYHHYMRRVLEREKNLCLIEAEATGLRVEGDRVVGVELSSQEVLRCAVAVITTGTFLRGMLFVGEESGRGGRLGEPPAQDLAQGLAGLGFELGRLKTGTPARLRASSIDFSRLEPQPSDPAQRPFSHENERFPLPQAVCHLTHTTQRTHDVIRAALHRSPLYTGRIHGIGPRYCPSIEDKVVRFASRHAHQVILEPTGLDGKTIYPNGISTSLPRDVQSEFIHTIPGLESAEMESYGYAVEYDYVNPTQLLPSLETRRVKNLFLAGQINGTSGYEEAAGQGLMAGLNASARLRGEAPFVLAREQAYIGVMIDDLVTRGTREPYRMFTARAEHRLLLREDNAWARCAELARRAALLDDEIVERRQATERELAALVQRLDETTTRLEGGERMTLARLLSRPEIGIRDVEALFLRDYSAEALERAEVEVKYRGYIQREIARAKELSSLAQRAIPAGIDFGSIPGLSRELSEKLSSNKPSTFAEASRIDGMTPAALLRLSVFIDKMHVPRGT
ncbi:MAG: tRNA uridine-5-carboxymethylaminomethyl(34) synthesis enzyme MnmG [Myxococcales bacterium]|nr:tRNA uridine-5-carboxymethylaminomethyl(34) synthesis enzyme MnmG [Myxococcales bacterium]